jgi:tetratricopeptide (TPR) repeat protein
MKLQPLIVHPLPAAPAFTGRETEMQHLREFWQSPGGVVSLIGLGGAGKTALARNFLDEVTAQSPPDGLLVWSFYDEPDANAFLQAAYQYFTGGSTTEAKGAGWFHLLKEALNEGGRYLLVLDGLERVQRQQTDVGGIYGEMEDPLLRGFLTRIAGGAGQTHVVITSRFPVSDLERWQGRGYTLLDVDPLGGESARKLLRSHGVAGDDPTLDRIIRQYGGHALTLDLLGGAVARFFGGDPDKLVDLSHRVTEDAGTQERRLGTVLSIYEEMLAPAELALLCRLCIFRFGVDIPALESIFLGADKETVAGEMATYTRDQLVAGLDELVAQHLTLRDGKGRFTIHPAVRDHFYRLFREPAVLHNAVRMHLSSLTNRPGIGLPTDKATLDLLEELTYHAVQSGNLREAEEIYRHRLGGNDHLNAELGEYVRTHRILRAFPECPDKSAMYHCMRSFGRFEDALHWRPQNRYILVITGRLSELAEDPVETTRRVAQFLQGEQVTVPERSSDMPIPSAMLHLYRGAVDDARTTALAECRQSMFRDDAARNELLLCDIARREGTLSKAHPFLESATEWVLNSGSQEHLALLHLVRGRLALDERNLPSARNAIDEGLHTCSESGFHLLRVDFLLELSRLHAVEGRLDDACRAAQEALSLARTPEMRFAWGEAEALHLLGELQRLLKQPDAARALFGECLQLRRRIGDLNAGWTERLLRSCENELSSPEPARR